MTYRQIYGIEFYKRLNSLNVIENFALSNILENNDLAAHISNSDMYLTQDQINELSKAISAISIQKDWGEIAGSSLNIYPEDGTVQVGYMNQRIPIQDFLGLLQEWLTFIS